MLTENALYTWNGQTLMALHMHGTWVLRTLDWESGEAVVYRPTPQGWRECRFVQTPMGELLEFGEPVALDVGALVEVDDAVDEIFEDLVAELRWEGTNGNTGNTGG